MSDMNAQSDHRKLVKFDSTQRCEGETFLGFTVKQCDQDATCHAYQDEGEQYDFCARHYYFWLHGRYPEESDGQRE